MSGWILWYSSNHFEYTHGKWSFYAYDGAIYIGRDALLDANGTTRIGYGYPGASNSQNRTVGEFTTGFLKTIWKDPKFGGITLMGQYMYLQRHPWVVASGTPSSAHDNTIYMNLRYTLPGGAPAVK